MFVSGLLSFKRLFIRRACLSVSNKQRYKFPYEGDEGILLHTILGKEKLTIDKIKSSRLSQSFVVTLNVFF